MRRKGTSTELERLRQRVSELEASLASSDTYAERCIRSSIEDSFEGIQIIDSNWRYIYLNATAVRHSRRTREELIGQPMPALYPGIMQTEVFLLMQRCMNERTPLQMLNHFTYPDGRTAWFDLRINPVPVGILVFSMDVTTQKAAEEERRVFHDQSIHDPLTGLFNRRFLEGYLNQETIRSARGKESFGLLMIDVDHFKEFNDTFGHEAGDEVLRAVGGTVTASIRSGDVACRFGGEEFVVILPDAGLDSSRIRAEAVREAVGGMSISYRGQQLRSITISLGVAIFPDHGLRSEDLIRAADQALYRAKHGGRNRVQMAFPGIRAEA
jgi:diguanylate cyclase (GGDEF)-like protein/PAS domain S-box-containing protein